MFGNLFKNFFKMSSFGLDISDESLKFVELIKTKEGIKLALHGEIILPRGIIESGEIKDSRKLEKILNSLRKDFGLKSAYITLPPDVGNIEAYHLVFKNSGIKIISFESKMEAISRAILQEGDRDTYMVVHIGNPQNNIAVISDGAVRSLFPISDALYLLVDEVAGYFLRWHTDKELMENRPSIKNIILCGGGSYITELSEYFSVRMKNEVMLANVWVNILDAQKDMPEISFDQSFDFAPALGLALKDFYR